MTELTFTVLDVVPEPYAAAPNLTARLRIEEAGRRARCTRSRCAARCGSSRSAAATTDAEAAGLLDLFGDRERWAETLRPFLWMQCTTMVQGFTGSTEIDLPLPCTYDFEVAGVTYLHALRDGEIPLVLLFSGTVFTRGAPASASSRCRGTARRATGCRSRCGGRLMDAVLPRRRVDAAGPRHARRARRLPARPGLTTWDDDVDGLLAARVAEPDGSMSPRPRGPRPRSPMPCSTRGTCSTPTGPAAAKNQVALAVRRARTAAAPPPPGWARSPACAVELPAATGRRRRRGHRRTLRFLQLQRRRVERADGAGGFAPVAELRVDGTRWMTWDEAVEREVP